MRGVGGSWAEAVLVGKVPGGVPESGLGELVGDPVGEMGKMRGGKELADELREYLGRTVEGRKVTWRGLVIRALVDKAVGGDVKAIQEIFQRVDGAVVQRKETRGAVVVQVQYEEMAEEEREALPEGFRVEVLEPGG